MICCKNIVDVASLLVVLRSQQYGVEFKHTGKGNWASLNCIK